MPAGFEGSVGLFSDALIGSKSQDGACHLGHKADLRTWGALCGGERTAPVPPL